MDSNQKVSLVRMLAVLAAGALLSACQHAPSAPPPPDYGHLMQQAESRVLAGQIEGGLAAFNEAARADPTQRDPWLRIAQLQFDARNYASAIVASEEVLQRDQGNQLADSIRIVSSLRIAVQSLVRMSTDAGLAGAARPEAEKLAESMRAALGEEILVPRPAVAARRPPPRPAARPAAAAAPAPQAAEPSQPAPQGAAPADPFSVLQGRGDH